MATLLADSGADIEARNNVRTAFTPRSLSVAPLFWLFVTVTCLCETYRRSRFSLSYYFLSVRQYGQTALIFAAHHGHSDLVIFLVDRGANVDARNNVSAL